MADERDGEEKERVWILMNSPSYYFNTNIPSIHKIRFCYGIFNEIEYIKKHNYNKEDEWEWMGGPSMKIGDEITVPKILSHRQMFDRIINIELLDILGYKVKFN